MRLKLYAGRTARRLPGRGLGQPPHLCFEMGKEAKAIISDSDGAATAVDARDRHLAVGTLLGLQGSAQSIRRKLEATPEPFTGSSHKRPVFEATLSNLRQVDEVAEEIIGRMRGPDRKLPDALARDMRREIDRRLDPLVGSVFDQLESLCVTER